MKATIKFRPICPADQAFLFGVFASTRPDVALSNLGEEEKQEFLQMQFRAQHNHYQKHFPDADFLIVMLGKTRIGRVYARRTENEIHIIDVALLPKYRGQGIGTQLMSGFLAEGKRAGKPVRLHVLKMDRRAIAFYRRLGFVKIGEIETRDLMEWKPAKNQSIFT